MSLTKNAASATSAAHTATVATALGEGVRGLGLGRYTDPEALLRPMVRRGE